MQKAEAQGRYKFHTPDRRLTRHQCDLQRERCGQCQRAGLACGGFHDPNQLVFRNETPATRQKEVYRYHPAVYAPAAPPSLKVELRPGYELRARQAFFSHYVFGLSRSHDVLDPLYRAAAPDSYLASSVDAVSLAFLAHQMEAPGLLRPASEHYLTAIRRLRQALRRPELAASDVTLQTILLLDLYEKIINDQTRPAESPWMSHIMGAIALVKLRGQKPMASYTTRRLSLRLAITTVISCATASVRIPDELAALKRALDEHTDKHEPKWSVTSLVAESANLAADIAEGVLMGREAVAAAKQLDSKFLSLENSLPAAWSYARLSADQMPAMPDLPQGVYYDQYIDHFTTQVRNVIRKMRILLHIKMQEGHPSEERAAGIVIQRLAREICSSASQYVWPASDDRTQPIGKLQALKCHTLLGPMYLAAFMTEDASLKAWAIAAMRRMEEAGGMKKAKQIADILEFGPPVPYWHVYVILGSYAFAA